MIRTQIATRSRREQSGRPRGRPGQRRERARRRSSGRPIPPTVFPSSKHDSLTETTHSPRGLRLLLPAIILIAGWAAYANSFDGVFLLDDVIRISHNPFIKTSWLQGDWLNDKLKRPLVSLSLAINYGLGEERPWGYHAFNLVVHLLAGLALFGVVRRTLLFTRIPSSYRQSSHWIALVVATIWVIHPLQTGSVTYVIQRCESMMGLFYLLVFYCAIRGACSKRSLLWYVMASVACSLGMACKAVIITAPPILLLYDRIFLTRGFRESLRRRWFLYLGLSASFLFLADGGLLANVVSGMNVLREENFVAPTGLGGIPPLLYAATQPGVIVHYLRLSFWPSALCLDYWWPLARGIGDVLPWAAILIALLAATAWALVRRPLLGFVGAWFFLILAPTSSIRSLHSPAFEHRMYLPLAAIIAMVVIGLHEMLGRLQVRFALPARVRRTIAIGLAVVATSALGYRTASRNRDYHSELAMWTDVIEHRPANPRVRSNLGLELVRRGKVDEAIAHLEEALRLWPDYGEAHNNLAMALLRKRQPEEALAHAEEALRIWSRNPDAHINVAGALAELGRHDEAIQHYREVLELRPEYHAIRSDLGAALAEQGRIDEAIAEYHETIRLVPKDPMAHNNLGGAYYVQGKLDEAIGKFREAIALKADYPEAHHNLGLVLKQQGKLDQAVEHYRDAIRLKPDYEDAYNNLAGALLAQRKPREAVDHYLEALRLRPDFELATKNLAQARFFLGVELEGAGKPEDAVAQYRETLRVLPDHTEAKQRLDAVSKGPGVVLAPVE